MSLNGIQMGMGSLWYQSSVYAPRHAATTAPVEPVDRASAVEQGGRAKAYAPAPQPEARLPELRQGADPVEMAVRGRIQYLSEDEVNGLLQKGTAGADKAADEAAREALSPAEMMEEGQCQTCKERKYQDGSNDPGVSFKTPTSLTPQEAATAVRGHEMEHVVREQAKAEREDRSVVRQSVTLHNEICPECGDVYISGGTTRTVTKADPERELQKQQVPVSGFEAVA